MKSPQQEKYLGTQAAETPLRPEQIWDQLLSHMMAESAIFPPTEPGALLRQHTITIGSLAILLQSDRSLVPLRGTYEPTPLPYGPAARWALRWIQQALQQSDHRIIVLSAAEPATFASFTPQNLSWEAVAEQIRRLAYLRLRISSTHPAKQGQLFRFSLFEEIVYPAGDKHLQLSASKSFAQSLLRQLALAGEDLPAPSAKSVE